MGTSAISIAGELKVATARRTSDIGISQAIADLEVKSFEVTVPYGAALTTIPLQLSGGVTEALFLHLYCPMKIIVEVTTSDLTSPGPVRFGMKGHVVLTLTPGEGVTLLKAINPHTACDTTLEVVVGAKSAPTDDDPEFYA